MKEFTMMQKTGLQIYHFFHGWVKSLHKLTAWLILISTFEIKFFSISSIKFESFNYLYLDVDYTMVYAVPCIKNFRNLIYLYNYVLFF